MDTGQRELLRSVRRVRRRVVLTESVGAVGHGVLLWLLGILTYLGVWGPSSDRTLLVGGVGLAAATVAAVIVVVWRAPSLASTARLLDQRLSLDERVETALEAVREESAIASLLRADAGLHLDGIDLQRAFPFRFRVRGKRIWLAASMLAIGVLAVRWIVMPEAWLPTSVSSRAGRGSVGDSASSGLSEDLDAEPAPQGAESTSARVRGDTSGSAELDSDSIGPDGESAIKDGDAARQEMSSRPSASDGFEGRDREPDLTRPGPQGTGESGSKADDGAVAAGEPGGQSPPGYRGLESPVPGGATVVPEDEAMPLVGSDNLRIVDWQGIENVLRRERLPPGLERHVRDYFLAISNSRIQP